ncbi:type II secretion system protein D (GspD) [Andreprevotia lacus DSM 23236]|uniref:Type II secretion system protein D (GspD) n=1 Tax=Andreprevotia lacus DSM 23236 TaxID=1121001 RepID=A0A1W1XYB7_9NEIS|nr:secretin N-terminal domain-containing protein [Andreprevotia lacus]SMC28950.1 type II secretion system protein D (GspD) [Andreprevotia lacus DSM 23236]
MKATLPHRSPNVPQTRLRTVVASLLAISMLGGCASQNQWLDNAFPELPPRERPEVTGAPDQKQQTDPNANRFYQTPTVPTRKAPPLAVSPAYTEQNVAGKESAVAFNSMPLPQFIDSVFGVILKKTINIDPVVAQRRDLVSMKTGKPLNNAELYTAAKTVLRSYGIVVQELPGLTRFVPDAADTSSLPEIRRGRALPEVPETLRPLFYLAELENTHISNASNWLRTAFKDKLNLQEDPTRNALLLGGTPQTVSAALQALQVLDQPMMRGKQSVRITPVYWTADELSKRLNDILNAEGYYNSTTASGSAPVVLVPIPAINSVLVFAASQATLDHTLKWAEELDQPSQANSGNYFIYPVRNADATDIAATLSQVMNGGQQAATTTTTSGNASSATTKASPRIVVNKATNSLIFQSTASEYQQWFGLIKELDRPAKSALVTVSVAEVRLQDGEQLGFEWLIKNIKLGGLTGNIGTAGAFATKGIGGLSLTLGESTSPAVILNALATATKARVLSNPTILTRSGEEATITVGQEVPTITSQQSNADSGSSTGGVLQTIQYRNTGVILKVKPVVHAGGRIDLNVSQEVSTVAEVKGGTALAPTISTRKVDTKLTVLDGNTVVLGGLMSDNRNNTNSGVPYAKDIPGLGLLFKSDSKSTDRTELIVLITAYSIEDDFDTQSISDAFRNRFPWSGSLFREAPKRNAGEQSTPSENTPSTSGNKARPYIPKTNTSNDADGGLSTQISVEAPSVNSNASNAASNTPQASTSPSRNQTQDVSGDPSKGKSVTDEALKKELLEALKGSLNK